MKKLYTLAALALTTLVGAQNLISNGNLETWSTPTTADGFIPVTSGTTFSANNFLSQETTAHQGTYSAGHTSQNGTEVFGNQEIAIVPGHSYTVSFWYLDNDVNARARIWSTWITGTGATAVPLTDNPELRPSTYSTDSPSWVQVTFTMAAPAAATHFRFQARTYRQSATAVGGKVYYDEVSFIDNDALATQTFGIDGLKMYPNPVKNGNLYITSSSNENKSVVIFDVLGKQVLNANVNNDVVNVSNLNAGVYIVKITEAGKTATKKLVVE